MRKAGNTTLPPASGDSESHGEFGEAVMGAALNDEEFRRDLILAASIVWSTMSQEELVRKVQECKWGGLIRSDLAAIQRFFNTVWVMMSDAERKTGRYLGS